MAISSDINKVQYTLTSTNQALSVPFYFLGNNDLKVVETNTTAKTDSVLTITTNYTVSGAGNENGGTVTMVGGTSGNVITILRDVDKTQTTDYTPNSAFPASSHEKGLDKLTMLAQQALEIIGRSLQFPESEVGDPNNVLSNVADRKGKLLSFDSNNGELSTALSLGDITYDNSNITQASTRASLEVIDVSTLSNGHIALMRGYVSHNDGGEGVFILDKTGNLGSNANNNGTILSASGVSNCYWRRMTEGVVNPKWFGAKGDGVTNDTSALVDCFDSIPSGGSVHIPAGDYKIVWPGSKHANTENAVIKVYAGTNVHGDGRNKSRLYITGQQQGSSPTNPYQALQVDANCVLKDLWFDGDIEEQNYAYEGSYNGNEMVHLDTGASNKVLIKNCKFSHAGGMSISGHGISDIEIDGCDFVYTSNGCNVNADNLYIHDCYVQHAEGFESSQASSGGGRIRLINNTIRDFYGAAISIGGYNTDNSPAYDCAIIGNVIDMRERTSPRSTHGITINDNIVNLKCSDNYIYGNSVDDQNVAIIVAQPDNRDFTTCMISNNLCVDWKSGVQINGSGSTPPGRLFLLGNVFEVYTVGIDLTDTQAEVFIHGNVIVTDNLGIDLSGTDNAKYRILPTNIIHKTNGQFLNIQPAGETGTPYYPAIYDIKDSSITSGLVEWVRTWNGSNSTGAGWFARQLGGKMEWGAGSSFDTNLYRSAADTLKTDDNMAVGSGTWNAGHIILGSNHLWVDASGDLRIKPSAPTSDTDGTVVGSQT